jgi:hypothetical protein
MTLSIPFFSKKKKIDPIKLTEMVFPKVEVGEYKRANYMLTSSGMIYVSDWEWINYGRETNQEKLAKALKYTNTTETHIKKKKQCDHCGAPSQIDKCTYCGSDM